MAFFFNLNITVPDYKVPKFNLKSSDLKKRFATERFLIFFQLYPLVQ